MSLFAKKTATTTALGVACALLLLLVSSSSSPASAEPSSNLPKPEAAEAPKELLANVLTFTPEQIASAESALNASAAAVFAAVNATRAAKAAFFQDAVATPFGQLKAGGLRAGGLVKRTNRSAEARSDWLTSELALAPFAKAFSQVSAAVESSPVGKAFFAATTTRPSSAAAGAGAAAAAGSEADGSDSSGREKSSLLLPTPREVLAKVGCELRLPGGGPVADLDAAVAEAEKASAKP